MNSFAVAAQRRSVIRHLYSLILNCIVEPISIHSRRCKSIACLAITVASTPLVAGSATGASVDPLQTAEGRIDQTVLKGVVKITSSPKKLEETTIGTGFFVSQEIQ